MKHNEVFLKHILDEITFVINETKDINFEKLLKDEVLKRASARSLEIIGEAVKNISPSFRKKYDDVEWKKLAGLRDKIIHYYFGVNWEIVWDVVKNKLPSLKIKIQAILDKPTSTNILKGVSTNDLIKSRRSLRKKEQGS